MNALTNNGKLVGLQHLDFTLRPDDGIVWLDELVVDRRHPERVPMIRITRGSLRATVREGLFPEPVARKGKTPGWELSGVRAWIRARDALNPATASPNKAPEDRDVRHSAEPIMVAPTSSRIGRSPVRSPTRLSPNLEARLLRAPTGSVLPLAYLDSGSRPVAAAGGPR